MLLNKKCVYLGATLFSSIILASLSDQIVKADTVSNNSVNVSSTKSVAAKTLPVKDVVEPKKVTTPTVPVATKMQPTVVTKPISSPKVIQASTATVQTPVKAAVINKDTVVDIKDPTLSSMTKWALGLSDKDKVTVGELQKFNDSEFSLDETVYLSGIKPTVTDQTDTAIESLDGMQALKYLPKGTQVYLRARLASDSKANLDLSPLYGVSFDDLFLNGNFSSPKAKEIDLSQLTKLNIAGASKVGLTGDASVAPNAGITQQQLEKIAPWLVQFANNGQQYNNIELNNGSISDFSPLKGISRKNSVTVFVNNNNVASTEPVYATTNKKDLTFTALPFKGIDGEDLASTYHYTTTVKNPADDNLVNVGGDNYKISNPDTSAKTLTYGIIGDYISSNDDSMLVKNYGNSALDYFGSYSQPLIWKSSEGAVKTGQVAKPVKKVKPAQSNSQVGSITVNLPGNTSSDNIAISTPSDNGGQISSNTQAVKGETTSKENSDLPYDKIVNIGGKQYYKISDTEYLLVNKGISYTPIKTKTVVKVNKASASLFDSKGDKLKMTLPAHSNWLTDGIAIINGVKMYRVSSDSWVAASSVNVSSGDKSVVAFPKVYEAKVKTPVYSARGKLLDYLPAGTSWKVDRKVVIKGIAYYRISTNEFIKA